MKAPAEIVSTMMEKDEFSRFLGMTVAEITEGYCSLSMHISENMTNGFGIAHGGISYSLADSTLAFAANSRGKKCVSIDTSITHLASVQSGDTLLTKSIEIHYGKQVAIYLVDVFNQNDKRIAHFKGTVKISENSW
jgi:acyl-CoA thioesterase